MEPRKAKEGPSMSAGLSLADKQIDALLEKILPHTPHLLSVPTKTPYMPKFPHENLNTPFEAWEVPSMQYMTLVSNADRGVGYAHGNWEESSNAKSPLSAEAPSSTSTPNPAKDSRKPAVKMSIADYKNLKTTGVKPSPRPISATPEPRSNSGAPDHKSTHSRNTSAVSASTPMARVPSFEEAAVKQNGVGANSKVDKALQNTHGKEDPLALQHSKLPGPRENKVPSAVNGNATRDSLHAKDADKDPRSTPKPVTQQPVREPMKHGLPPRPQSPRHHLPEPKQQKRPLESGDISHSEKRAKTGHSSESPTISSKSVPRKSGAEPKSSPAKPHTSDHTPSHASESSKKATPSSTRSLITKPHSSKGSTSEAPLHLPPLLSPLPADLEPPPQRSFASLKKSDASKAAQPKTPSQPSKEIASDTIVVRQPHSRRDLGSSPLSTPPKSTPLQPSAPFILPRLLSPDLPDIVEAELHRLQQKSATLNSVEARHEKARLPGAPGVAQKRPKVGHPPKKTHAESSAPAKKHPPATPETKSVMIVKLSYKKKNAKRVQGLLRLPSRVSAEFKARERHANQGPSSSAAQPSKDDSESEDDVPLATNRAIKAPVATTSKKRPAESDRNESAPKRSKATLESINVAKSSTPPASAFKSPALTGPSLVRESGLLATPKKNDTPKRGDAMKSVAMRKVDSSDGHARTPQPTSTSTPVSAEKPRARPEKVLDREQLDRARQQESKFYPLGTTLKRQMQATISKGDATDDEKQIIIMRGIEGLMAYMLAFHYRDQVEILSSRPQSPASWEQFFPIWNFVEQATKPQTELRALLEQLGAVAREQLVRIYMVQHEAPRALDVLLAALKQRDALWGFCKRSEPLLEKLGVKGSLGPASSVAEAVGFAVATLKRYAVAKGLPWDGDVGFSNAPAAQFVRQGTSSSSGASQAEPSFTSTGSTAAEELKILGEL